MRALSSLWLFVLLVSTAACGHDPVVHARFRAGQTAEEVLRELTVQREHLYVAVRDEGALRQRLKFDIDDEMPMSRFISRFSEATQLEAAYHPYEMNSPRGTLKVRSRDTPATGTIYAVIHHGRVRYQAGAARQPDR